MSVIQRAMRRARDRRLAARRAWGRGLHRSLYREDERNARADGYRYSEPFRAGGLLLRVIEHDLHAPLLEIMEDGLVPVRQLAPADADALSRTLSAFADGRLHVGDDGTVTETPREPELALPRHSAVQRDPYRHDDLVLVQIGGERQ